MYLEVLNKINKLKFNSTAAIEWVRDIGLQIDIGYKKVAWFCLSFALMN